MFWYEQSMTFPANCIKEMFQPVDDIVDFDSAMWSDVKDVAEQFTLNGKHFVAPINFLPGSVITYDKSMIDAAGLDDPYELYQDGKWDWNAWYDMMSEYVEGAAADEERYGINGWFAPFIFQSTGKTLITYDADKDEYVSNLNDADFVRASDMLYDIAKNGMYYPDWVGQAGDAFKKNILFYAMGPWASTGTHSPKDGDNWGVVPMPKDPNSDTLYTTIDMNAYMWVKGSTKNDAMKCWLECAKIVYTQDTYKDIEKEKFFVNNPNWTEDMPDHVFGEYPGINDTVRFKEGLMVGYRYFDTYRVVPQFEFGYGLSYTTFTYSNIKMKPVWKDSDTEFAVSFTITNTGKRYGQEIAQLYLHQNKCSVERPFKELKGFTKVGLKPGESKQVTIKLPRRALQYYDTESKCWKDEPGMFTVLIGASSRDIKLQKDFELKK